VESLLNERWRILELASSLLGGELLDVSAYADMASSLADEIDVEVGADALVSMLEYGMAMIGQDK